MWQFLFRGVQQRVMTAVALPVAIVCGSIGYMVEGWISDRYTPYSESIKDKRTERLVDEELKGDPTTVESLKEKRFVPKTVFERNVSPSLQNIQEST